MSSLVDLCKKCGREFGEHDGKKCPKPPKAKKPTAMVGGKRFTLERIERELAAPAAKKHPPVVRGPQLEIKTVKKSKPPIAAEAKLSAQVAAGWTPGNYGTPEPGHCKQCNEPIPPTKYRSSEAFAGHGKPRTFCDAKCRKRYSRAHPRQR